MVSIFVAFFLAIVASSMLSVKGLMSHHQHSSETSTRRQVLQNAPILAGLPLIIPESSRAAEVQPGGLAALLKQRDPLALKNRVFNLPPPATKYPEWLRGSWDVTSNLNGYIFPSQNIPKQDLVKNPVIPGFQKCSVAATADIGKENVKYKWIVDETTGLEDRVSTLRSQIDAYLGYEAIRDVSYSPMQNPNRLSIEFLSYKTVNAERIEIFCNSREYEEYVEGGQKVFVCSEFVKQVTFGTGSTVGIPRQVGTNYANFWTWKQLSENEVSGNLLTAGYLDPQDSMYFLETVRPVVVYSHTMKAERTAKK